MLKSVHFIDDDDDFDPDVERHRPLLEMGIPMDTKSHSVGSFVDRLNELERSILTLDYLGKPLPTHLTKSSKPFKKTKENKTTSKSKISNLNPKVNDYYKQLAPTRKPIKDDDDDDAEEKSKTSKIMSPPRSRSLSPSHKTNKKNRRKKKNNSPEVDVTNDAEFNTFVEQAAMESRYCIEDDDILQVSVASKILEGRAPSVVIEEDERLMFDQGVMGLRRRK